jgi:hypothetical protein
MLFVSAILLLYSAAVVPFQICMWDYSDPCNIFPTLQFDMFVDSFFMVHHTSLLQLCVVVAVLARISLQDRPF